MKLKQKSLWLAVIICMKYCANGVIAQCTNTTPFVDDLVNIGMIKTGFESGSPGRWRIYPVKASDGPVTVLITAEADLGCNDECDTTGTCDTFDKYLRLSINGGCDPAAGGTIINSTNATGAPANGRFFESDGKSLCTWDIGEIDQKTVIVSSSTWNQWRTQGLFGRIDFRCDASSGVQLLNTEYCFSIESVHPCDCNLISGCAGNSYVTVSITYEPAPMGSCCLPVGVCTTETEGDCATRGGAWIECGTCNGENWLYYADFGNFNANNDGYIRKLNLGAEFYPGMTLVSNIDDLVGLIVDQSSGFMYYSNARVPASPSAPEGSVRRVTLSGGSSTTIMSGLDHPKYLALDSAAGKLYVPDQSTGAKIHRRNSDGSGSQDNITVSGLVVPYGIAIDSAAGKMYITDENMTSGPGSGTDGFIMQANLDGTGATKILENLEIPRAIAIDTSVSPAMLYFCHDKPSSFGTIERVETDGSDHSAVVSGVFMDQPQGITLDVANGRMFWTDGGLRDILYVSRLDGTQIRALRGGAPSFGGPAGVGVVFTSCNSCDTITGDVNGNGSAAGSDVQGFTDCVISENILADNCACADVNLDGVPNENDIFCFVDLLLTGGAVCGEQSACSSGQPLLDCNENEIDDWTELTLRSVVDCNSNNVPDECDIASELSEDDNASGVPDECEPDCQGNGTPDDLDLENETSVDCNANAIPDECEFDCNENGVPDDCDVDPLDPDGDTEVSADCNGDGSPDECDADCDANGVPDDCDVDPLDPDGDSWVDPDCNANGWPDECDVMAGPPFGSLDTNENRIPDECEEESLMGGGESMMSGGGSCDASYWPEDFSALSNEMYTAWEEFMLWCMQEEWGPESEYTGVEQLERLIEKKYEVGICENEESE